MTRLSVAFDRLRRPLFMNRFLFIALAGFTAIGFATQNLGEQPDATVTGKFVGENGVTIEGIGACSATADAIDCWDMAGHRDTKLNAKMKEALQSRDLQFRVRFGSKNRFLLVRASGSTYVSLSGGSTNRYGESYGPVEESGDSRVFLISLPYKLEEASGEVIASLYQYQPPKTIDIPFAKDSTGTADGVKVRISSWTERKQGMPEEMRGMYIGQQPKAHRAWSIFLDGNFGNQGTSSMGFQAIGADGEPISYVDKSGNPVRAAEFLRESALIDPAKPPVNPKYTMTRFVLASSIQGAQEIACNLNPARISRLRLIRAKTFTILIKGFPLDPL